MEPLSIASGVAGLITLADVVLSRTYDTIIACKNASRDAKRLLQEVQTLSGILRGVDSLETKLGTPCLRSHVTAAHVLACQQTLQKLRDKLLKSDPQDRGLSKAKRILRIATWPFSKSEMEAVFHELERHKSTFNLAIAVDALDNILNVSEEQALANAKLSDIRRNLSDIYNVEVRGERRRILKSLGTYQADSIYHESLRIAQSGTGLWFIEGAAFSNWASTANSGLWAYGIAGAGKTILSALSLQRLLQMASQEYAVTFYYCDYRNDSTRHLSSILKSVVGQLARQNEDCMALLEEAVDSYDDSNTLLAVQSASELLELLKRMFRTFTDVAILIDGLDECHDAGEVSEGILDLKFEGVSVHTLVFSRHETNIEPFLIDFHHVKIAAESQDLRLYVPAQIEERVRRRKLRIRDNSVKDLIIDRLVNGADGM